jgi:rhamnulokinase
MPRKNPIHCAAVDLGATSGRILVGTWSGRGLRLEEVHRFPNQFRAQGGHEYLDLPRLWQEVRRGLRAARRRYPKLASIGVDTWGVDHVLVDGAGRPVFPVHAYRDLRTQPGLRRLAKDRAALARIYAATGVPNVFYNSSLQLEETISRCPSITSTAVRCLFLPDYFNYLLSGRMENEISFASTTQLLEVDGMDWSRAALGHFRIPSAWFTKPILAGTVLGPVRDFPELKGVLAVAVPGHDTACAYDAMPADPGGADLYISSGTWSLVGFESGRPVLGAAALKARVSNERTGDGRYRPLTNVAGLWLLEQALKEMGARPRNDREWKALLGPASRLPAFARPLDVADPAFANPASMCSAIDAQLAKRRLPRPRDAAGYTRLICDSIGQGHADALRMFERIGKRRFRRILIVGGGSRNRLICQSTADASRLSVHAFTLEGSAVGNIASQLVSLGSVPSLAKFRSRFSRQLSPAIYRPGAPTPPGAA